MPVVMNDISESRVLRTNSEARSTQLHALFHRRKFWIIGSVGAFALLSLALSMNSVWDHLHHFSDASTSASNQAAHDISNLDMASAGTPAKSEASPATSAPAVASPRSATAPITAAAPMIARTVALSILVKDIPASRPPLDALLARHHGYVAQLNVATQQDAPRSFQASLRIPAPELAAALAEIKSFGRVLTEEQSGEEVTQQHADLAARLQNARETEEQLRGILQQRTGRVSDILEVEEEIARVRGEIESMEAQQQALEHRVDFAEVNLTLTEDYKAQLSSPGDSPSARIHNAFVAGYRNAQGTLLGLLLLVEEYGPPMLIWLAILGAPAFLVYRRYRRLRNS